MKFQVPKDKDNLFSQELFAIISEHVSDLASENEKLPNQILFTGGLGIEILNFINEKEWDFKGFKLEGISGVLDSIIFKYNEAITQVDDRGGVFFEKGGIHGMEISGIPGPQTISKLLSVHSSPSFRLERTVRPEKRILLVRK